MVHVVKFAISAAFILLGIWAFMELPLWIGIAAFFLISIAGHGLAVLFFKHYATPEQIKEDLQALNNSEWDILIKLMEMAA